MCGRYAIYGPHSRYREQFGTEDEFDLPPRFNVAPSQVLPVVRQEPGGGRRYLMARWGLLPSWVRDPDAASHPINAKAETAATRPMFRHALRKSRVLVPADGFYEWKIEAGGKQPFLVRMRDRSPFGMAGLLEHWRGPEGDVATFAILTTDANGMLAEIYDRMPAIIRPEDYATWLDPEQEDVTVQQALLGPYPEQLMEAHRVGRRINNPANEGPDLIEVLSS
jgi:putative SOS response-associated peptidase YedK